MTVSSQSIWLLNLISKPYPCFRSYYAGAKCCSAYLFLLHPSHPINNFILLMIWGVVYLGKPPLGPWGLSCSQMLTGASIIRKPYGADGSYPLELSEPADQDPYRWLLHVAWAALGMMTEF